MIDKKIIKKMMHDILRHKAGLSDHKIMHPVREWFLGLALSLVLLIASAFGSLYVYKQFNQDPSYESGGDETVPVVVYREPEIKQAIKNIEARQTEYNSLKATLLNNGNTNQPVIPPDEPESEAVNPLIETSSENVTEPIIIPREPESESTTPPADAEDDIGTENPSEPETGETGDDLPTLGN